MIKNDTSLSDLIKQLKAELTEADQDVSNPDMVITSAQVSLNFTTEKSDDGNISFFTPSNNQSSILHNLTLTFSRKKTGNQELNLTIIDDPEPPTHNHDSDDFEAFKKRFQANVKLKHGQSPSKKKSIFDD